MVGRKYGRCVVGELLLCNTSEERGTNAATSNGSLLYSVVFLDCFVGCHCVLRFTRSRQTLLCSL